MRRYPAKLLLFGEHILLLGASALSVPVPVFGGSWEQASAKADIRGLQMRLSEFVASDLWKDVPGMDLMQFKKDLLYGLFFRSDIPLGYGLGSSGALCAAIYDRYCRSKTQDMAELKTIFARMESFYHGSSSGIDPLTSYLNKPLLIRNKTDIVVATMAEWKEARPVVMLLDTNMSRQTGPLVQWFIEKSGDPVFSDKLKEELLPAHEAMVQAWLSADTGDFWQKLRQVSLFQYDNFHPMIPASMHDIWKKSLESQGFSLKICGAGGGGFMLGFAKERETAEVLLKEFRGILPFENASR